MNFLRRLGWLCLFPTLGQAFDLGLGLGPPGPPKVSLRYVGLFESDLVQTNLTAGVPVWVGEGHEVAVSGRYNELNFESQVPQRDLYDLQLGATYTRRFEEKHFWSLNLSFGSASDRPFKDPSVNTVGATAMYMFPQNERGSWLLLVNYSNNRPILNNVPLPGFAYIYVPSKTFRGIFGVPFASLYWEFVDSWSVMLFTVAPWIAKAQLGYRIAGPVQAFAGVDFSQMTYLRFGRTNMRERLYYDERKVFLGLRSPLSRFLFAELESGYAMGRQIFSAESYRPNPSGALELSSSFYARASLSAAF